MIVMMYVMMTIAYLEFLDLAGDVPHESLTQVLHAVRTNQLRQRAQLCVT